MDTDLNRTEAHNESDAQMNDAPGCDPYLVAAVNSSQGRSPAEISENIAVALDDMAGTCTRRRATLLQLQVKRTDS